MEMQVIDPKNVPQSLYIYAYNAFMGLYARTRSSFIKDVTREHKTEAERRAWGEKQRYDAQALAACWQGYRLK